MANKIKALIAEDVELMRRLLRTSLLSMNCEIAAEVSDGARVKYNVQESQPDIVFLDINLPNKNGLDVLEELKSHYPDLFVVIVSAHNSVENIQISLQRKADGFLAKPFTILKIKETLENLKERQAKSA